MVDGCMESDGLDEEEPAAPISHVSDYEVQSDDSLSSLLPKWPRTAICMRVVNSVDAANAEENYQLVDLPAKTRRVADLDCQAGSEEKQDSRKNKVD